MIIEITHSRRCRWGHGSDQDIVHIDAHTKRVTIDFNYFISIYFCDTDFLISAEELSALRPQSKHMMSFCDHLFGVVNGLPPHPDELEMKQGESSEDLS